MRYVILLLATAALSGCASLPENADAKLVTQYAAIKICDTAERAARCAAIADEVRRYVNDTPYPTVALLMGAIEAEIDWTKLDPADTLLARSLLDRLEQELVSRLGAEVLPEDLRLATETVSRWIQEAVSFVT